jgi:DNA-binding HxlR family transcriptional regulator
MLYYSQRGKQNRKWEGTNFHETHTPQTLRLPDQLRPGDLRRPLVAAHHPRSRLLWEEDGTREFLASEEGIATNILALRLAHLEQQGILEKQPHDADKRKERYILTEKGLDLIPVLVEMGNWSAVYDPQTAAPPDWIALVNADKPGMIRRMRETVRRGGSVFVGPESVLSQVTGAVQA